MLLIHANIHTMEGKNFPDGYLEYEDQDGFGKILRLGNMEELPAPIAEGAVDLKGALLLPGFIDPHSHMGMWEDGLAFEGDDGNEETDPITPQLRALDAVNPFDRCFDEALEAGITTVLTGPGSANPIAGEWLAMKTAGNSIDEMAFCAPVGMKFSLGENPKNIYNGKNQTPSTRMATAALIREQLHKAKRYLRDLERSQEEEDFEEPEYDIKCEALIPVLKREIKAFFHAHRADDIFTAIRIAKEFQLDYAIIHATEGWRIASALKREDAPLITGPILCDRSKPELRNQSTANTALLKEAGIDAAICTDHPVIPIQYLPLSAAICVKAGLDREEALKGITIYAAEITGIAGRVGSLRPGKDADLLIFDGDPLDVMTTPRCVILEGKVRKGELSQ